MKPNCVTAVQEAAKKLGRNALTAAQLQAIDDRINATMRRLARSDPDWQAKSTDQRVIEAAQAAMADIQAEAARKVANAQRQILKTAATDIRITEGMAQFKEGRSRALVNDIDNTGHYINGIKQEAVGNMVDLMEAAKTGEGAGFGRRVMMFLFDADNPRMTRDLATEIYRNGDGSTGNKIAAEGAKAYLNVIEGLRQRFNSAGGDVGRLEYGYIPQPHDAAKVRGAGDAAAREAWVDRIAPLLDRSRYVLEDGSRMGDAEFRALLGRAWETISSDGANKREPGAFGGNGAKANAGSESRQIHFKDADSYMAYMKDFGTGSMYDAVIGHVGRMARDIGLIERYGPNPNSQMRLQFDLADRADGGIKRDFGLRPQSYWDQLNGTAGTPQSAKLAQLGTDARNIQTFGKLGSAVISSITDLGTFMTTTGYNKLGYWDAIANLGKTAASKDARDFMTTHGIIAESMIGDMNRWTGDNIRQTWSGRLANSTMKLSLMNAWTDTLRRAFSLTMMQGLARMSKTEWGKLTEWDRTLMERRGITEADWQVITKADLTEFGGKQHLTPEAIRATNDDRASEVVAKVLGLIQNESEFAVLNPDLATKTLASGGATQRGTVRGELARSVMQFKSFPIAMVSRHWRRMLEAPQVTDGSAPVLANRVMYAGALMVTTTALGAIALQAKQLVAGKDPIDMQGPHAGKFWTKAVAQGGGLSIVGDFLLADSTDQPGGFVSNAAKSVLGPALGSVFELASIGKTNIDRKLAGKTTHTAAESLQWARANTPYTGIWYARAALDHAGLHALQENLSPGYLGKMKARSAKDFGQSYWWNPGTGMPDRAPDFGKAVGQ
ncbi:hypothetical protein [Variovorax atrisoli]|uniref:hypothetical protein n=1 Tax=Variovorax atrisoli TaxID=3394203 RepID=UPI000363809F|nr:hypothetical protein [Variovorax paradoxus]